MNYRSQVIKFSLDQRYVKRLLGYFRVARARWTFPKTHWILVQSKSVFFFFFYFFIFSFYVMFASTLILNATTTDLTFLRSYRLMQNWIFVQWGGGCHNLSIYFPILSIFVSNGNKRRGYSRADSVKQAGYFYSSRAPDLTSAFQGSMNVHRDTLLFVPQLQCFSSFWIFVLFCLFLLFWFGFFFLH